jgi:DNA-binding NtrC family response regulator
MKKILFVGKFNATLKNMNNFFENLFQVQICVDNVEMLKGMIKLKRPELVVVSLIEISADAEKIFEELKCNHSETPVLCIGSNEEANAYKDSISTPQFTTLITPIDNEMILDTIYDILDISYIDDKIIDADGGKKSILLVDDSKIQLRTLNEMLKQKYEVRMAISGMQAITMITKKKPDMIFLDYEMPVCDGRMTLQMIRELEEAKDIPVVFLTGVSDREHITAVLELKPAGYLLKPADSKQIFSIIEKVLG